MLSAPEKLRADHDLSHFHSGEPSLDDWLRRRALQNEESGASRTYVVCAGRHVVGYYALAVGAVAHAEALGRSPELSREKDWPSSSARCRVAHSAGCGNRRYPRDTGARDFRACARVLRGTRVCPFPNGPTDAYDHSSGSCKSFRWRGLRLNIRARDCPASPP